MLGSVKTNIGHLESAAGIAGLIKIILMLRHGQVPPHLHLQNLNPLLAIENSPIVIPTHLSAWTSDGAPRRAGVSSFGFGGTNAHVILEEPPQRIEEAVSASRSNGAAAAHLDAVRQVGGGLGSTGGPLRGILAASSRKAHLADLAFTANTGRTHFTHRAALVADSVSAVREKLRGWRRSRCRWACGAAWWNTTMNRELPSCSRARGPSTPGWGAPCTRRNPRSAGRWIAVRTAWTASWIGRCSRCWIRRPARCWTKRATPSP